MHLTKHNLPVPLYRNNYVDYDDPKSRLCTLYLELLVKVSEHQPYSNEVNLIEQKD
jgi:hypothetical protein